MLTMFVVLEGFDIGAGMLQYVVGKTEADRRTVIAAIGPLWSWNEVWLVGFGGTFLLAFPEMMTAAFSRFYLALLLLAWSLLLRGISIEVSGHIDGPLWSAGWHFCFVVSNVLLAVLCSGRALRLRRSTLPRPRCPRLFHRSPRASVAVSKSAMAMMPAIMRTPWCGREAALLRLI
jgi:cytochrome bd-type quinol oxidase subunit 2